MVDDQRTRLDDVRLPESAAGTARWNAWPCRILSVR